MARGGDETILKILVVDDQPFQRRLITETLRSMGRVSIEHVENADQCMLAFLYFEPDLVVTDWALAGGGGLDLVKRLRAGEAGEQFKKAPVIMVAERMSPNQLDKGRAAGIDEFVVRPFSTTTLLKRVKEVKDRRREFVESTKYTGPCRRRRKRDEGYDGPRRRLFDGSDKNADSPDVQIRKGLARMYVERIQQLVKEAATPAGVRDLALTCGQLSALASDMKDKLFMSATSSLFSYIKGIGAEAPMNEGVVKAHLDAILQLAELPNSQFEIRQTVTQQLGVMVTKKLRQAGQAA